MIITCKTCNGTGNASNTFPYIRENCKPCCGTGLISVYFFRLKPFIYSPEINELMVSLRWYADEQMTKRINPDFHNLQRVLDLNHHICKDMSEQELTAYVLKHYDANHNVFRLPEVLTLEQLETLHNNNQNQINHDEHR